MVIVHVCEEPESRELHLLDVDMEAVGVCVFSGVVGFLGKALFSTFFLLDFMSMRI